MIILFLILFILGESDPLTIKEPTLVKNPFDIPNKMDKPEVVDCNKDHVDLSWKTPEDGGAPIEEFIVEKVFFSHF